MKIQIKKETVAAVVLVVIIMVILLARYLIIEVDKSFNLWLNRIKDS